jgi:hypothetical protein
VRGWILVCTFLVAASGAAEAGSSDPMVWSDAQWRSSLFGGYTQTYNDRYDRRFRRGERARAAVVRIEQRVAVTVTPEDATPKAKPQRAKLIRVRSDTDFKAGPGVLRFDGHKCRGVLVLTWGTLGAKSRCYQGGGRINTP